MIQLNNYLKYQKPLFHRNYLEQFVPGTFSQEQIGEGHFQIGAVANLSFKQLHSHLKYFKNYISWHNNSNIYFFNCANMVVEIQCCVNSTNQHAQRPSPAPESSGPLKTYYLARRDFLRGKCVPATLFRSWFLRWKHNKPKVPSS